MDRASREGAGRGERWSRSLPSRSRRWSREGVGGAERAGGGGDAGGGRGSHAGSLSTVGGRRTEGGVGRGESGARLGGDGARHLLATLNVACGPLMSCPVTGSVRRWPAHEMVLGSPLQEMVLVTPPPRHGSACGTPVSRLPGAAFAAAPTAALAAASTAASAAASSAASAATTATASATASAAVLAMIFGRRKAAQRVATSVGDTPLRSPSVGSSPIFGSISVRSPPLGRRIHLARVHIQLAQRAPPG